MNITDMCLAYFSRFIFTFQGEDIKIQKECLPCCGVLHLWVGLLNKSKELKTRNHPKLPEVEQLLVNLTSLSPHHYNSLYLWNLHKWSPVLVKETYFVYFIMPQRLFVYINIWKKNELLALKGKWFSV